MTLELPDRPRIEIGGISTAEFDPQPRFPHEDVSPANAEKFKELIEIEFTARPDDSRLANREIRSLEAAALLRAMFGEAISSRQDVNVQSIELGANVFDDMTKRLTGGDQSELVVPGRSLTARGLALGRLSDQATSQLIGDFEESMPNAASVVEVASRQCDTRAAMLGAVTSRSLAILNNTP